MSQKQQCSVSPYTSDKLSEARQEETDEDPH